jgi:methionine-rich copper-binding protein CopC
MGIDMRSRTSRAGLVLLGAMLALLLTATAAHAGLLFPQANDDTASTTKNHAVNINVLANDTVPSGFVISAVEIEDSPQHGTATVNADKTIHYVPDDGYTGDDFMMYNLCWFQEARAEGVVTQGNGQCGSTGDVDITVTDPTPKTTTTVPPTTVPATVAAVTTTPATDAPTTTVAAAAATNELPRTGGGNGEAAAFGAIVVAAGLALVGGARYRRRHA